MKKKILKFEFFFEKIILQPPYEVQKDHFRSL